MGNVLEFFLKMKDMMSGGLVKMGQTAQQSFNKVQSHVDRVTGRNKVLSMSFDEIERKIRQTEAAIRSSNIPSQIKAARSELERLQRMQAGHAGAPRSGGGLGIGGLGLALGMAGGVALGGNMLMKGLDAQARQTSFEVMAGKEGGTRLNKNLTKFAQDSIYGNEVFQNAQTMMGFGIGEKDVMANTKMLGDVAMGNSQKLQSLTLAFSQVSAAGKLTGQDLLQFINAGFNPLQEISKKTGLSLGDLKKKVEDGAISFEMVKSAFQSATSEGGTFFQMTDRIAQTDFGKWQAFQGQIEGFSTKVGGMLAPALGDLVTNYLSPFVDWMGKAAGWIQENSTWLGLLVSVIGTLALGIGIVSAATSIWASVTAGFNAIMAMNPIVLVVIAIAALTAGIIYAYNKFGWFRGAIYATWEAIKGFGLMIKDYVIDRIKGIVSGLGGMASAILKFFKGDFSGAWDTAKQAASDLIGVDAKQKAVARMSEIGKAAKEAYNNGVAEVAAKNAEKKGGSVTATAANAGGTSLNDVFKGIKGGKGTGDAESAVRGVTGGGPRVININGVKFTDKIELHTMNAEGGIDQLKGMLEEMFLRILNSGAAMQ